jgi:hypothetical protein
MDAYFTTVLHELQHMGCKKDFRYWRQKIYYKLEYHLYLKWKIRRRWARLNKIAKTFVLNTIVRR